MHTIKYKFKKLNFLLILALGFFISNCTEKNILTKNSKDKTTNVKVTLIEADFGCYKLSDLDSNLKSGAIFYPRFSATNRNSPHFENCPTMANAKSMDFTNRPVILLVHGFNSDAKSLHYQAKYLARMGIVAMTFTTKSFNNPKQWVGAYQDMLKSLQRENSLAASPVFSKIDTKNISLMGHSMGGGGLFYFADKFPLTKFASIIALAPYNIKVVESNYPGTKMASPVLVLSGSSDGIALPHQQQKYYNRVPNSTSKALVELKGVGHSDHGSYGNDQQHKIIDKYIQDWVKIYVYKIAVATTVFTKKKLDELKASDEIVKYSINNLE